MTFDQKRTTKILLCLFVMILMVLWAALSYKPPPVKPIESTRAVVLSCTVKSNIEGVITLNDDCKITVIGEE